MEHLLHHVQTWVPLVGARDPETKLLVDVDRCLQEFVLMVKLMLAMMDILMVMLVESEMMTEMVTLSLWVGSKAKLL